MTMSETGLANRVKAIERACGQHAVAKMKLFATVLALEGYVELAEDASSAYGRLKELLLSEEAVSGFEFTCSDSADALVQSPRLRVLSILVACSLESIQSVDGRSLI